ncbi:MAG: hypothetical protein WAW17_25675 [Rhodococcus sp. (in: high G+C Gram-positive bacteria)]|uniref:hypothetical protein n=1 Tax=Rhodococcus sp. TaxID=1831 RepID=UPI003BAE929C
MNPARIPSASRSRTAGTTGQRPPAATSDDDLIAWPEPSPLAGWWRGVMFDQRSSTSA